jgi:hypothetical protein
MCIGKIAVHFVSERKRKRKMVVHKGRALSANE